MTSFIKHYGVARRSGRYPYGSGKNPEQRGESLLGTIKKMQSEGLTEKEIGELLQISTSKIRRLHSISKDRTRQANANLALSLKDKGWSYVAIGERLDMNESSVRSLLNPVIQERAKQTALTASVLRTHVMSKGPVDVGLGVEAHLGISRTKLDTAIEELVEFENFELHTPRVTQLGTNKKTIMKILAPPGMDVKGVVALKDQMSPILGYFTDHGDVFNPIKPIENVSRDRVDIRYGEDGGKDKDGILEIRPGVADLTLGGSRYAQVRVGVDGTHFMKGMAIYSDNLPDGKDIVFNTNKHRGTEDKDVFKPMKFDDPENPFGSTIERQNTYIDKTGKERVSPLNIVNDEGSWGEWSRSLSSQVLSKQRPDLAKKLLGQRFDVKEEEYNEILSLTNPAVKKRLLDAFADDLDSSAVHLKAAALPGQASRVILPLTEISDKEVYAPGYKQGDRVVLVRHPHGGIFEIPELIVNNRVPQGTKFIGEAKDAIGIHPKVAEQLSGADFDGDSVLVIPNNDRLFRTARPLAGLKDFNPKDKYKAYPGMPLMTMKQKQREMGDVSNLITDMTIMGAPLDEIERAVRHSMVVIDAEKHKLNYTQSAEDNGIKALKIKYQGAALAGAATIVSKASSQQRVPERKDRGQSTTIRNTDPETGEKIFVETRGSYIKSKKKVLNPKTGIKEWVDVKPKLIERQTMSTKMAETNDAFSLVSPGRNTMEVVYATHANKLKAMANDARRTSLAIKFTPYSPEARSIFASAVSSLKAKLNLANRNKPLERQAQLLAGGIIKKKLEDRPDLEPDDIKKLKSRELTKARLRVGAKPHPIEIDDNEWSAIQAGAVSKNVLEIILANTDLDAIKQRAMPREYHGMSPARVARATAMAKNGASKGEIADALGVSINTLNEILD